MKKAASGLAVVGWRAEAYWKVKNQQLRHNKVNA